VHYARAWSNPSIERTAASTLCVLASAAHVERYASASGSPALSAASCGAGFARPTACERSFVGPFVAAREYVLRTGSSVRRGDAPRALACFAARRKSQNALRRAAPRPCRSSRHRRVWTRVLFKAGSHNLSFERTAFGRRSLTRYASAPGSPALSAASRGAGSARPTTCERSFVGPVAAAREAT
jgi:hypothetical protein